MSTRVGTLKPSRSRSIWPAAVVLSVVMLTVAVIAISLDRGSEAGPATAPKVQAPAAEFVSGTAANTPSELRGITSSERVGAGISFVRHVPKREVGAEAAKPSTPELGTNTPSEVGTATTSKAEIWARQHLRRP